MLIGIVGKPNVGKSTFFSAATMAPAEIADYPFTTIKPNRGVAFLRTKCPHVDFGVKCNPRNAPCENGTRLVPVELLDVAGLVPDAWQGKGLGNQFLDDLRQANALIHVVDASGATDAEGNPVAAGSHDPADDVAFLEKEIDHWIKGIIEKGFEKSARQSHLEGLKIEEVLYDRLTGLSVPMPAITSALRDSNMPENPMNWHDPEMLRLCAHIRKLSKPMTLALNKADVASEENLKRLTSSKDYTGTPTCAQSELALKKASKAGLVNYQIGAAAFEIKEPAKLNLAQKKAIDYITTHCLSKYHATGVQQCLESAAFKLLDLITVYPVEDEHKLTDHQGLVLPDAHLIKRGSTAKDLAYKIHTDLGDNFIRAINCRTNRVVGAEYLLQDGDVITIITKK
jgi:ribosome-binding ATPase YchF (GTP1/OBG family)